MSEADWPVFQYDLRRTGFIPVEETARPPFELAWSFETDGKTYRASPSVVDGILYVGPSDQNVYAPDAATGFEMWRYGTGPAEIFWGVVREEVWCVNTIPVMDTLGTAPDTCPGDLNTPSAYSAARGTQSRGYVLPWGRFH